MKAAIRAYIRKRRMPGWWRIGQPQGSQLPDFLTGETARQIFERYGFSPAPTLR